MGSILAELKRRNVFRVAAAYTVVAWVVAQVMDLVTDNFGAPGWLMQLVLVMLIAGLPVAMLFSWAFEITRDGVVKTADVPASESITPQTGRRLNLLTATALLLAVGFIAFDKLVPLESEIDAPPTNRSVAVLPFSDMSEDRDQEWFADGLTEEILNSLGRIQELAVTARASSFSFKQTDADLDEIAAQLGVANIVSGSVRRIGEDLRVTARLIRVSDGYQLWSDSYDRKTNDLFDVQRDIAGNVAGALDVILDDDMLIRLRHSGTDDVQAFEEYVKGVGVFAKAHARNIVDSTVTLQEANEYFDRALSIDPEFSSAALLRSDRYAHRLIEGAGEIVGKDVIDVELAHDLLVLNLRIAAANARGPVSELFANINLEIFSPTWHRLPGLLDELDAELRKGSYIPSGESVWVFEILLLFGRVETAAILVDRSMLLDPLSRSPQRDLVDLTLARGDLDGAQKQIEIARRKFGPNLMMEWRAFRIDMLRGNRDLDLAAIKERFSAFPDSAFFTNVMSILDGDLEFGYRFADELDAADPRYTAFPPIIHSILGDHERARVSLRKIDARPGGVLLLSIALVMHDGLFWFDLDEVPNLAKRFEEAGIDADRFRASPSWPSPTPKN